jgi:hypothetical protein
MRYVRVKKFVELSGYTDKAVYCKISSGVWREGCEYRRAPDGNTLIDLAGFERWVEGGQPVAASRPTPTLSVSAGAASPRRRRSGPRRLPTLEPEAD